MHSSFNIVTHTSPPAAEVWWDVFAWWPQPQGVLSHIGVLKSCPTSRGGSLLYWPRPGARNACIVYQAVYACRVGACKLLASCLRIQLLVRSCVQHLTEQDPLRGYRARLCTLHDMLSVCHLNKWSKSSPKSKFWRTELLIILCTVSKAPQRRASAILQSLYVEPAM